MDTWYLVEENSGISYMVCKEHSFAYEGEETYFRTNIYWNDRHGEYTEIAESYWKNIKKIHKVTELGDIKDNFTYSNKDNSKFINSRVIENTLWATAMLGFYLIIRFMLL